VKQMENKKGFDLILQERRRQIEVEGWTSDHDDNHESGEIGRAGACYETAALHDNPKISHTWPWATEWWKPKDKLKNLTRAGALFLAESEKQKRLGDTIKADYWFSRATIVAKRIEQMENEKTAERHKEIERLATALWIKFYSNEYGMTKDLFTLAIQDERIVAQQTASLQSELSALQERNKKLEEALRELHSCTLYELGPGDERDTHAPWQLFDKVVQALRKESK
jgi:hypothetical protein